MRAPDDTDLQIIEALRKDPQVTNKAIAGEIGVAERTVAYRVKAMSDDHVMRVVAQKDILKDGYELMCFTFVYAQGRPVAKIAQDIAAIEEVTSVSLGLGRPEFFVNMRGRDRKHLQSLVKDKLGSIKGVQLVRTEICLEIAKYISGYGDLSGDLPHAAISNGRENKDEQIVGLLLSDGRMSNREIARRLDVSEANVRQRLRKMDDEKYMRLGVVCDAASMGIGAVALIHLAITPNKLDRAFEQLARFEQVAFLGATTGQYGAVALANTTQQQELVELCDNEIASIDGVFDLSVYPLIQNFKHRYDLIRIK